MIRRIPWVVLLFVIALSCGSPTAPSVPAGATPVVGTVHFFSIEGGFWAVRGDDGVTYDPLGGLPPAFQHENMRVTMIVKPRTDLVGIHNVGPIVEIIRIDPV
jgi:hypothetical protein